MLTAFVSSFGAIIFTYSILVGIGIGLISISCLLAVLSCFENQGRNQAVSISMTGSTFGDIILPQIVGYLLMYYGFKTAVFSIGILALLGTFSAMLFPSGKLNLTQSGPYETTNLLENPKKTKKESDVPENTSTLKKIACFMDLLLLKDKKFLILTLGISIGYTVNADFGLIFPLFLKV
jgi:MFS family permease